MPLNHPYAGTNWAAEYTVSPLPWVTSSTVSTMKCHDFPYLTKYIALKCTSGTNNLSASFTANGFTTGHYFELIPGESIDLDVRTRRLFLSGSSTGYTLIAGLTGISERMMPHLTGSDGGLEVG